MAIIPRDRAPDSTYALLLSEGYRYILNRCRKYGTDLFGARIMLRRAVCMLGSEAAAEFYCPGRFTRNRALPLFALTLIQDFGSVMVLDGEDHRRRKEMFLSLMTPDALAHLSELMAKHWRASVQQWQRRQRVVLLHEAHIPLCAAICEWSGLALSGRQMRRRAREFEAMIDGAGSVGPRNWRGHRMRARTERWARRLIRRVRSGATRVPEGSAAQAISTFRDQNGKLLDVKSAAVEFINILRPTVATARYIVFGAMAIHANPEWRGRLRTSDRDLEDFVNEVRRYYPFIPFIGGRVLAEFTWRNHRFRKGDWVLMDLYGTNHDARTWGDPEVFRPERFRHADGAGCVVSHGAGDRRVTHRCPGEWATVETMKTILRIMAAEMEYSIPPQDLQIDLARIPALPKSGFIVRDIRWKTG